VADQVVVLGGWGVDTDVLRPVFGDDARYIDTTALLPHLVTCNTIHPDWPVITARILEPYRSPGFVLAGWSTGALLAYGAAPFLSPSRLQLASATLSFCRTASFRHGMRPSVIAAMKYRLKSTPQNVLDEFSVNCGFPEKTSQKKNIRNTTALVDGLTFLEQAQLGAQPVPECRITMLHGNRDRIIPPEAGRIMSSHCGAGFTLLEGPHACFINNIEKMKTILATK